MSAANTDLLKKLSRKWVGQIGSGGVADAVVTTIPLASTTNLPTDTAVELVIDRVDSSGTKTPSLEETIVGVVSGSNIVTSLRGVEGTAQAHLAGAVVEVLVTADGYNDIIDHLLVGHLQDGRHAGSAITASNIAASAIRSGNIAASAVVAGDLAASAVLAGNLAASAVLSGNIGASAVLSGNLGFSVTTPSSTDTFTNKTIDATATGNSISNLSASNVSNRTRYITLGVGDFVAGGSGTPVIGSANGGNAYAWLLDAAQTEDIWATLILPADLVTGTIVIKWFWSMETATTGDVFLQSQASDLIDGTAIDTIANHSQTQTVTVPGTADTVKVTTWTGFSVSNGNGMRIRVLRLGADVSDTAAGDMVFYGARLEYTADM